MKITRQITFLLAVIVVIAGGIILTSEWREKRLRSQASTATDFPAIVIVDQKQSSDVIHTEPTLKQLICKLDSVACKMKLQYEIDQQWVDYRGKYWVGFAWSKDKDWSEKEWWYVADSKDLNGNFRTKEEAVNRLLEMLQKEKPNMLSSPHSNSNTSQSEPELEPRIDGPKNCDPHRQCK